MGRDLVVHMLCCALVSMDQIFNGHSYDSMKMELATWSLGLS